MSRSLRSEVLVPNNKSPPAEQNHSFEATCRRSRQAPLGILTTVRVEPQIQHLGQGGAILLIQAKVVELRAADGWKKHSNTPSPACHHEEAEPSCLTGRGLKHEAEAINPKAPNPMLGIIVPKPGTLNLAVIMVC